MVLIIASVYLLPIEDLLHHVSLGVDGVIQAIVVIAACSLWRNLGLDHLSRLAHVILVVILVLPDNLQVVCGCIGPDLHWAGAVCAFLRDTAIFIIDHVPYNWRLHFSSILRQLLLALKKGVWETDNNLLVLVWNLLDNSSEFLVANKLNRRCVNCGIFFLVQSVISIWSTRKVRWNVVAKHSCIVQVWRWVWLVHQVTLVRQFAVVVLIRVVWLGVKSALVFLVWSLWEVVVDYDAVWIQSHVQKLVRNLIYISGGLLSCGYASSSCEDLVLLQW